MAVTSLSIRLRSESLFPRAEITTTERLSAAECRLAPLSSIAHRLPFSLAALGGTILAVVSAAAARAADPLPQESPRRTATVKLIERSLPSVVAIRALRPTDKAGVMRITTGSGTLIHPAGYVLTNHHVIDGIAGAMAMLPGNRRLPLRVIASWSFEDLALVKVEAPEPLPTLPVGRSHDLMLGEPVLVVGDPGGLAHSVSTGIISGLHRATSLPGAFHPWLVQTSAAVNPGNSGGPMINALGELVGVVTGKKTDAENIGFAIGIDRVREVLPRMLSAQERYGFWLGIDVDMLAPVAVVSAVAPGSPAAQAGVRPGDVIRAVNGRQIRQGIDFHIALIDRKPAEKLELHLVSGDRAARTTCTLADLPLAKPVGQEGMVAGMNFATYQGMWEKLPDFSALKSAATGKADGPTLAVHAAGGQGYGIKFTGYVKAPADGLYTFYTKSDDGSRLYIGDQLIVDNDGLHPAAESAGMVRLAAGLHPITVTFFQAAGEAELSVSVEGPGLKKQPIPPAMLFVPKPAQAKEK